MHWSLRPLAFLWRAATAPFGLRSHYEAARTNDDNRKQHRLADGLGPVADVMTGDRKTIRQRARQEVKNNSYAKGLVLTLANNLVGKGPRLQVSFDDQAVNAQVEGAWRQWAYAIRLGAKLRTMKVSKTVDGEAFALLRNNPALPTSVKLDLRLIEADQVTTPLGRFGLTPKFVDGIEFDDFGNATIYHVLKTHPGDFSLTPWAADPILARYVLHWFRADRPGQPRGISELAPCLELLPQVRRFGLATLTAAETAALLAAIFETNAPANDEGDADADAPEPYDRVPLVRGTAMIAPDGYKARQLKPEHPASNFEMFVYCLIREIARCLNVPLNIALGDSSKANYSSARLDHLLYRQAVDLEREDCEREVLEPTFAEWLDEATKIPGLLPPNLPAYAGSVPHTWHWDAWEPIDLLVEEQAATEGLTNGSRTLADIVTPRGQDWRRVIDQQVAEEAYRRDARAAAGLVDQTTQPQDQNQGGVSRAA